MSLLHLSVMSSQSHFIKTCLYYYFDETIWPLPNFQRHYIYIKNYCKSEDDPFLHSLIIEESIGVFHEFNNQAKNLL